MLLSHLTGDNVAEPSLSPTGLIDSPTLESDAADDARATLADDGRDYDAIYAREVERDEAERAMADAFPDRVLSLSPNASGFYRDGRWTREENWLAMVHSQGDIADVCVFASTASAAVESCIKAYNKAHAPVRTTPEHRQLVASTFEAFGRIAPESAADFLELVEQHHGRSDFLEVLQDGRVLLAKEYVEGSEAQTIGGYVAQHLLNTSSANPEAGLKVVVDRIDDGGDYCIFRAYIVLPNGERRKVAGAFVSELDARAMAQTTILNLRPTITTAAIVTEQSAA